jgi:hypothetical protein
MTPITIVYVCVYLHLEVVDFWDQFRRSLCECREQEDCKRTQRRLIWPVLGEESHPRCANIPYPRTNCDNFKHFKCLFR